MFARRRPDNIRSQERGSHTQLEKQIVCIRLPIILEKLNLEVLDVV